MFATYFVFVMIKDKNIPSSYLEHNEKIVAFGDSLTFGYAVPEEKNYPSQLQKLLLHRNEVLNYGINGNTTSDGLLRINEVMNKENPKLVLLNLGGNDFLRKIPEQETIANLKSIIKSIKSHDSQIILMGVPKPNFLGEYIGLKDASIFKQIAKEENVIYIEDIFSKYLSDREYKVDLIHLNAQGYELVAQKIFNEMINYKIIEK